MAVDRAAVAHHEAAHAVVAQAHGIPCAYLSIEPEGGWAGHMRHAIAPPTIATAAQALALISVSLAGYLGEALHLRGHATLADIPPGSTDYRRAFSRARQLGEPLAVLEEIAGETVALLRERWADVEDVAQGVMRTGYLDGATIRRWLGG